MLPPWSPFSPDPRRFASSAPLSALICHSDGACPTTATYDVGPAHQQAVGQRVDLAVGPSTTLKTTSTLRVSEVVFVTVALNVMLVES